jgi:hypothetical protein
MFQANDLFYMKQFSAPFQFARIGLIAEGVGVMKTGREGVEGDGDGDRYPGRDGLEKYGEAKLCEGCEDLAG